MARPAMVASALAGSGRSRRATTTGQPPTVSWHSDSHDSRNNRHGNRSMSDPPLPTDVPLADSPSQASSPTPPINHRLTSDMISFRATEIPVENSPSFDGDGRRSLLARHQHHRLPSSNKRHSHTLPLGHHSQPSSSSGPRRYGTFKIESVPPPTSLSSLSSSSSPRGSLSVAMTTSTVPHSTSTAATSGNHTLDRKSSLANNTNATTTAINTTGSAQPSLPRSNTMHHEILQKPMTIWSAFTLCVQRHADALALSGCEHGHQDRNYTWIGYYQQVLRVAKALVQMGLTRGDGVIISAKSSTELYILNVAVTALGGVVAHIRSTWTTDELVDHIFVDSKARFIVLDELHHHILTAVDNAKTPIRAVIVIGEQDPMEMITTLNTSVDVLNMAEMLQTTNTTGATPDDNSAIFTNRAGAASTFLSMNDLTVELQAINVSPMDCCLLSFGYDAHGKIQGTRLSHDNVLFTASTLAMCFGPLTKMDRMVGYIQLYHIAAQVLELYLPMMCGLSVVCAPSYKDSLVKVITARKPTIFFATPDTWARFSVQVYKAKTQVNSFLYRWAKIRATHNSKKLLFGQNAHRSVGYMLAKKLVLNNIKKRIGLESCQACYSVLAPLDFELEKLFKTIDIPIYQLFGCAETTGFAAINYPHAWEFGSSGRALKGTVITCDDHTQEVLLRGRNVFLSYVRNGQIVPHLPHQDGWYRFSQRGFLTPTDFLQVNAPRDFCILSTGDWIPIKPFEEALAVQPELDRAVLIGDNRPFLSVLLFLKTKTSSGGHGGGGAGGGGPQAYKNSSKPGSALLSDEALLVGKTLRSPATTVADAIKSQAWAVHFDAVLENLPQNCGLSGFQVRKWILMTDGFAAESGEIDPDTGDVNRRVIDKKYQSLLDSLYS